MDLDEAAAIPFAIWALCNLGLVAILIGSLRDRGYEIIRGGLFLSVTASVVALSSVSIQLMWDLPPWIDVASWFVWGVSIVGAAGALVMIGGFLRRDV